MKNTNYQLAYSKEAAAYVSDITEILNRQPKGTSNKSSNDQEVKKSEAVLTRSEVEKMLEEHLSKIETLLTNQETQMNQLNPGTSEAEVLNQSEKFLTRIKTAFKEFKETLRYLVGNMTDDMRLTIKNGINRRILRISAGMKKLGEMLDRKFAIEKKVPRIDPRQNRRNANKSVQEKTTNTQQSTEKKESKEPLESSNVVEIDVSKSAKVTFDPPRIQQEVNISEKELQALMPDNVYDFKKVSEFAFNKRAAAPKHNWQVHQEKFGDQDLNQAWKVFMKDAWDIQTEISPMLHSELATNWEKEYYDFFYIGGKEAYDSAVENGTPLKYSPEAMKHFETLYDNHIAKSMQEHLEAEITSKQLSAPETTTTVKKESQQSNQQEEHVVGKKGGTTKKSSTSKPNKFEQRKAAAIKKNKQIEKNLAKSTEKQVVNDAPRMK